MGQNQFIENLVEVMLSWMRWLTGWFWNVANSEGISSGFTGWFSDNWLGLAIFLIVAGVIVDWLIWMIRWRPYWLWLRKRQIIYEEVTPQRKKRAPRTVPVREAPAAPAPEDYFDPFASSQEADPYEERQAPAPQDDLAEWDSTDDPYARQDDTHTDYDPRIYARPSLGDTQKGSPLKRTRPVFGERMKDINVDDGK